MNKNSDVSPSKITRRKLLTLTSVSALGFIYYFAFHKKASKGYTLRHSRPMMGTIVNFTIIGKDRESCSRALKETVGHMEKVGFSINRYDRQSPLTKLNNQGYLKDPDPILVHVLKEAIKMAKLTDGAFDPTILPLLGLYKKELKNKSLPKKEVIQETLKCVDYTKIQISDKEIRFTLPKMSITLDGLGKGYVVDEGIRFINKLGFTNVCIEAGGDLMTTGTKKGGDPWTIGIRSPRPQKDNKQLLVKLKNQAIATSGDYLQTFSEDKKHHHIINPRTGYSSQELASSSIIAPTLAQADGLATSVMVMGAEKGMGLIDSLPDCEGLLIEKDLKTHISNNFIS